ncbi:MAG TPA: type II secretion system F family protein [Xanthobacteraceae bacterium]|nr:type II secretion system F family protein [Xanthobacteraceae bacterium]
MSPQMMAVFFLATVSAGSIVWVFIYPLLTGERRAEKRHEIITRVKPGTRTSAKAGSQKSRRDQVEASLKEIDERRKAENRIDVATRISQAGLKWSKRTFMAISAAMGLVAFILALVFGLGLFVAAALGFAGAFGMPRWLLSFLKKRRERKFLSNFPDAVDVIVRGLKAGLPLADCLKIITNEAEEPIKSEFQTVIDTQAIGVPMGEACAKLYESVRVPETNFFGIVISIQQKSGGNLSEALGNLSRVLRDRKKMQAKIKAMSQEAKASAGIIGALPFVVATLVYLTSPKYMELLWTTSVGPLMLAGGAFWMSCGIFVMRKMINFDF